MPFRVSRQQAVKALRDLVANIQKDNVSTGAAALAYYLMLAVFPATIALLTLLPYLPIPHLEASVMDFLRQVLPGDAAELLTDNVRSLLTRRRGGLLSFGLLFAIWSAANGMYAVMQQLNITYEVVESRPFWKRRGIALLLMLLFFLLIVGAFGLVVLGGYIESWLLAHVDGGRSVVLVFTVFRWAVITLGLTLAFALIYYLGPDARLRFRFVTPGGVAAAALFAIASLGFRLYVSHFAHLDATYGSIGAAIILLLWLDVTGLVILLGSEVNALVDRYARA